MDIERLKKLASKKTLQGCINAGEDECISDWYGSNVDDAYSGGVQDGETMMAREFLDDMGVEYEVKEE